MGRQAGQQIGGQGDQSAAAGHRVHQSAQKDQGTYDQQGVQQLFRKHKGTSKGRFPGKSPRGAPGVT